MAVLKTHLNLAMEIIRENRGVRTLHVQEEKKKKFAYAKEKGKEACLYFLFFIAHARPSLSKIISSLTNTKYIYIYMQETIGNG